MLKIFVGYDTREDIAYQVCRHSILKRSSIDVEVIPIKQQELRDAGIYTRGVDKLGSTEFTFTRFFVPYLTGFTGQAVFCDCDFIWLCDAKEVLDIAQNLDRAVAVVKHNYTPTETIKMDNKAQVVYPRKNWSSFIIYNCEHPSNFRLTPEFLNVAAGSTLHQFKWLKDTEIKGVSHKYNYLEGWYKDGDPKIVHYTRGGPWFDNYQLVDYAEEWIKEKEDYLANPLSSKFDLK